MNHKKLLVITMLVMLPLVNLRAGQEKESLSGVVKTNYGLLFVWNAPNNYFMIEIRGKKVEPTPNEELILFAVDGMFLQLLTTPTKGFLKDDKKRPDGKTILTMHRDWEVAYLEAGKVKLTVESSWHKLSNGSDALLWRYDTPEKAGGTIKKQFYLTVLKGDHVLLLNSGTSSTVAEDAVRQLLLNTAATLKTSDKPLDLLKLADKVREGKLE